MEAKITKEIVTVTLNMPIDQADLLYDLANAIDDDITIDQEQLSFYKNDYALMLNDLRKTLGGGL